MPTAFALTVAILLQTPAQPQTPAPASQPTAAVPPPPAQAAYVYQVEGRRDPFVSLIGRGADGKSGDARLTGLPGLQISEVMLKGILKDHSGFFALLQGPDNKTYQVRSGDKLLDGSVKSINGEAVIFSQDVNDPLSVVKQREITKRLRSTEEGRE
jgi:Tfp pilus assembly protein PilP